MARFPSDRGQVPDVVRVSVTLLFALWMGTWLFFRPLVEIGAAGKVVHACAHAVAFVARYL